MTTPVYVDRAEILANLRSRGLDERARWVERDQPQFIDIVKNSSLLRTLGIDPGTLSEVSDVPVEPAQP